jgi:hypothetical protein
MPKPPRLVGPLSATFVTSRRPRLRWELGADSTGAVVQLCSDRACTRVIETLSGDTSAQPTAALPRGAVFWRAYGTRGKHRGQVAGATWIMHVGGGSATVDSSGGHVPDLDGDGRANIMTTGTLYANRFPGRKSIFFFDSPNDEYPTITTQGDGIFDYARIMQPAGDIDGDGFADVVVANEGQIGHRYLEVFRGGPGGISAPARVEWADNAFIAGVDAAGDVNGDGYGDVVFSITDPTHSSYALRVAFGSAAGLTASHYTDLPTAAPGVVNVADFNGDGHPDLTISRTGGLDVYYSNGNAFVGPGVRLAAPPGTNPGTFGRGVRTGDVNGDGHADLLVVQGDDIQSFHVYFGGAPGLSLAPNQTLASPAGSAKWMTALRDINGDGYGDLVAMKGIGWYPNTHSLEVHLGGPGGLPAQPSQSIPWDRDAGRGTLVGDIDGDGYLDVGIGFGESLSIAPGTSSGLATTMRPVRVSPYLPLWDGFGLLVAACE